MYLVDTSKFFTTEGAAEILKVDPESVRRYVRSGELKSVKLGNKFIRIAEEDLKSFINQRKTGLQELSPVFKSGKIWHSPLNVYWHTQKLTEELGQEGLKKHPKYKQIRESQIASVIALIIFRMRNIPAFIQLYKPDPPDALIMQQSPIHKGQLDISTLEITQYLGGKESLFDQLKRTKIKPGLKSMSSFYILVVDLWPDIEISDSELAELNKYLMQNDTPYPVWIVQQVQASPDTIAELTFVNPEIHKTRINIGELAHIYQRIGAPNVLNVMRTGNPNLVRTEKAEKNYSAPWETVE